MAITPDRVRNIFKGLENGDGAAFFEHVADNVDWIVEGTHPLAGHYLSKQAFIAGTFAKLGRVLPQGAQLHVENMIVNDDHAWLYRPDCRAPDNLKRGVGCGGLNI
jgi:ketosteroid isomerase-like protein